MIKNKVKKMDKESKLHNDLIFVVAICLIAGIFFGINFYKSQTDAKVVVISVNGQEYKTLSLDTDKSITIEGEDGAYNVVTIQDGEVFMEDASCPDHVCQNMGHISMVGAPITCLPNKVVVTIKGSDSDEEKIDSVVR
jgi:hypothetical protein